MARFRTLVGLGLASTMMITAPVFASSPTTTTTKSAVKPAAKPTTKLTAKPAAHSQAKPATRAKLAATPARASTTRSGGRMVKARLSNGKTVTYDCSLAGNKTKQACKG
ncbi:hypothetical protein [Sphingopyxis lindanitolerans]|uniref:hypothetical protein n=1 Tax=Sphingopyxis lindanitolerans TaxID=2054227 RepID=UPI001863AECD|nr:hypothetical protein [Sphingopyxis lindanitolerans]